jgi:hypothetical protein
MQVPVDFILATNKFYVASTGEIKFSPLCIRLAPVCIHLPRGAYLCPRVHTLIALQGTAGVRIYPHVWISNIAFELPLVPIAVASFLIPHLFCTGTGPWPIHHGERRKRCSTCLR